MKLTSILIAALLWAGSLLGQTFYLKSQPGSPALPFNPKPKEKLIRQADGSFLVWDVKGKPPAGQVLFTIEDTDPGTEGSSPRAWWDEYIPGPTNMPDYAILVIKGTVVPVNNSTVQQLSGFPAPGTTAVPSGWVLRHEGIEYFRSDTGYSWEEPKVMPVGLTTAVETAGWPFYMRKAINTATDIPAFDAFFAAVWRDCVATNWVYDPLPAHEVKVYSTNVMCISQRGYFFCKHFGGTEPVPSRTWNVNDYDWGAKSFDWNVQCGVDQYEGQEKYFAFLRITPSLIADVYAPGGPDRYDWPPSWPYPLIRFPCPRPDPDPRINPPWEILVPGPTRGPIIPRFQTNATRPFTEWMTGDQLYLDATNFVDGDRALLRVPVPSALTNSESIFIQLVPIEE